MFIVYDLIFLMIAVFYLPVYLLKGKFHKGFLRRLGFLPKGRKSDRPIWVHAVSVGEALSVKGLIEALRSAYPGKQMVITTVTATGNKIAKGIAREGDLVTYLPLDFSFITEGFVRRLQPSLAIIAETEFWPNLISSLSHRDVPVIIVNGRISGRSFRGYRKIRFLLKPLLEKVRLFCVQSSRDAERLGQLGVDREKIRITGNMKFDVPAGNAAETGSGDEIRQRLGLAAQEKFLVAGSTHPGEEEVILAAYKNLLKEFSGLRILIAPRHPERSTEIEKIVQGMGFSPLRISLLDKGMLAAGQPVFILDSVGRLQSFYRIADVVFVGGSLVRKGGHNILEPAFFAKPIISGGFVFNFADIAEMFVADAACVLVNSRQELESAIAGLFRDPGRSAAMGRKAKELLDRNRGATLKTLECIRGLLEDR